MDVQVQIVMGFAEPVPEGQSLALQEFSGLSQKLELVSLDPARPAPVSVRVSDGAGDATSRPLSRTADEGNLVEGACQLHKLSPTMSVCPSTLIAASAPRPAVAG
jgi:hypothetical protein